MKKLILLATICLLTSCDALSESKAKPSPSYVSSVSPTPTVSETPGPTSSGLPTPSPMSPSVTITNSPTPNATNNPSSAAVGQNPSSGDLSQLTQPTNPNPPTPTASPKGKKLQPPSQIVPTDPNKILQGGGTKPNPGMPGLGENPLVNNPVAVSPQTISGDGIGAIKVGTSLGDVKKMLKNTATFEVKSDFATGFNALAVVQKGKVQFYIPYPKKSKLTNADQVRFLVTENPNYKTAEGVSPGMTIKQAAAIYGAPRLANKPLQPEEMVMFASQPGELRFFTASTNSKNRSGIYPKGKSETLETEKYNENGRIKRIAIICQQAVCGADQPEQ
jgi:hypothetical protein